jgi:hypothetical protein
MGYLIEPAAAAELVKFETLIKAADMQQLFTAPYDLTPTQKAGFIFSPVSAYIQVNGTTQYSNFLHLWITQGGVGTEVSATFGRTGNNILSPGTLSSFIVNIDHGTTPTNKFGVRQVVNRDYVLEMDQDDATGDGDGFVTIYGYYIPVFI